METWRAASVPSLPGPGADPHLANTASGELTRAAAGHRASLYACGITPYDATHLGHAATYVAWDLLARAWLDSGRSWSAPIATARTGGTWRTGRSRGSGAIWRRCGCCRRPGWSGRWRRSR